jgi:Ankyrin repeats (many copies)
MISAELRTKALHVACFDGHIGMVKLFLNDPEFNVQSHYKGMQPIHAGTFNQQSLS